MAEEEAGAVDGRASPQWAVTIAPSPTLRGISIRQLKLVHTATHPAATLDGRAPVDAHQGDDDASTEEDLLGDLEAEGDEEGEDAE